MKPENFSSLFPLGSHLCREPMPTISELKHDMEVLKQHGFNLIKLQEHWMIDEPLEGQYDFSKYEELIEHASRLDLGIYLGLTCEQAPGWLYRKYPDCRMVGRNGQTILYEAQTTLPADGKPGPCYDHPGALADQDRFIRQLVQTLGKYETIIVWNTWQEIGYWSQMLAGQPVCFCENTLAAFRGWLAEKYVNLDGLNRAWNTRYSDWAYVQPDRGAYNQNALPHDVDWRYFMDNVQVANVLRARARAIKESDPLQRPVFAHKGGIGLAHGFDWTYARTQDFLGSSCYPAWGPFHSWDDGSPAHGGRPDRQTALVNEIASGVALTFDHIRSCNPPGAPIWAAEFQGGPVSTMLHKGRVPSPEDIRRWMLTAVASGVTAISFWVTRAEIMAQETNGFALLDSEGDDTPRLAEAARVGAALNRHGDLFGQPSWGGAEVGILVSEWNAQLCTTVPPAYDHLAYSTRGWHRLLWELGIPVDFVNVDVQPKSLPKVLILPFPLSISEETAAKIVAYVEQGGHLICEATPGRLNEHNQANRGEISPTLRALFGVNQTSLMVVREPEDGSRWTPGERTWGEFAEDTRLQGVGLLANEQVQANVYIQTFTLETNRTKPVCMTGDKIAGVMRNVGKGTAWLIGTYLGHNGTAYRNESTFRFVKTLLAQSAVNPTHDGKLLQRKRQIPGKEAWFFTNPTSQPVTETINVGQAHVEDLLGGSLARTGNEIILTVAGLDVRVLVVSR
jgi:beta-galactosidase